LFPGKNKPDNESLAVGSILSVQFEYNEDGALPKKRFLEKEKISVK